MSPPLNAKPAVQGAIPAGDWDFFRAAGGHLWIRERGTTGIWREATHYSINALRLMLLGLMAELERVRDSKWNDGIIPNSGREWLRIAHAMGYEWNVDPNIHTDLGPWLRDRVAMYRGRVMREEMAARGWPVPAAARLPNGSMVPADAWKPGAIDPDKERQARRLTWQRGDGHYPQQYSDMTECLICGLRWDTNDPEPPGCLGPPPRPDATDGRVSIAVMTVLRDGSGQMETMLANKSWRGKPVFPRTTIVKTILDFKSRAYEVATTTADVISIENWWGHWRKQADNRD